jgi:hypothetical protein
MGRLSCCGGKPMPFKHHADRRHKFAEARYRVRNWREYEAGLRRRGSLTLWLTDEAIAAWSAPGRTTPGGQPIYSDLAIETTLMLRLVFHLPLRQTEGFLASLVQLLDLAITVPDHSTLSRRAADLPIVSRKAWPAGPIHLLVDSTGLKVFGAGEWRQEKHGVHARRTWRKLHLAVDADTGEIVASTLTPNDVDDASQVGLLLDQVDGVIASLTGDGAYDSAAVYRTAAAHQLAAPPAVVVPPRSTAVPSPAADSAPTRRDQHLLAIAQKGRMAWQKDSGYNRRALAEVAVARYKRTIGPGLRARTLSTQKAEAAVAIQILNRMAETGMPVSVRVA